MSTHGLALIQLRYILHIPLARSGNPLKPRASQAKNSTPQPAHLGGSVHTSVLSIDPMVFGQRNCDTSFSFLSPILFVVEFNLNCERKPHKIKEETYNQPNPSSNPLDDARMRLCSVRRLRSFFSAAANCR